MYTQNYIVLNNEYKMQLHYENKNKESVLSVGLIVVWNSRSKAE